VEAVEKAKLIPPALVILDVMMPKIDDGIQAYQKFKSDRRISDIPIIILSAIAKKTFFHSIRMLSSLKGSQLPEPHAYMEKPPDAGDLGHLIRRLLRTDKKFI
jgi:CheY-like chemotaxis protein